MLDTYRAHGQQYFLVVVPEDENPYLLGCDTVAELIEGIQDFIGKPVSLFPFLGHYLGITKHPRHLRTPCGDLPLIRPPRGEELPVEESGYVGEESNELAIAQNLVPPTIDENPTIQQGLQDDAELAAQDDGSAVLPEV